MFVSGMNRGDERMVHPLLHEIERLTGRERPRKDAGARRQAKEAEDDGPRECNLLVAIERRFPPRSRPGMLRRVGIRRVQQNVQIDDLHGLLAHGQLANDFLVVETRRQLERLVELCSGRKPHLEHALAELRSAGRN